MVYVLTGVNEHSKQQKLHAIIADFKVKHGGSIEQFDAAEEVSVDKIADAVRSISFLDPRKLVIVRSIQESKELLEKIEDIINQTADSTDLVLVGNLDKRTTIYKELKTSTEFFEFSEMNIPELTKWVNSYASNEGGNISISDSSYLIDLVGTDQNRLQNEINKLLLSGKQVDRKLIDIMVEPKAQSKIFTMLEELFKGNAKRAWELYEDQRTQGEEPQKIIAMIVWQLQQLALAVYAPEKTTSYLMGMGMSSFSANKSLQLSKNIDKSSMKLFITELANIDYQSKTSAGVESALAVYFSEVAIS